MDGKQMPGDGGAECLSPGFFGKGDYRSDTTVTKNSAPSHTGESAKMLFNVTCAIAGNFVPAIGIFGVVFGTMWEIADAIEKNDNPPEPGYANTFVYLAYSSSDISTTDRVEESQIDAVDSLDTIKPRSQDAYISRRIAVGDQLTLSIQINSSINLEAVNTQEIPNSPRQYTTSGEYLFKNGYTLGNFQVCVPMGVAE